MKEAEDEAETEAEAPQSVCPTARNAISFGRLACVSVWETLCACVCVFVQDLYIFNFRFYECNANTFSCMNKSNDLAASACRIHKRQ